LALARVTFTPAKPNGWLAVERDRKSDVPVVILYAEFTAKPDSESVVQTLISDLAQKVRQEPEIPNSPSTPNATTRVSSSSSRSTSMMPVFKVHITAEYGVIFNQQLSSLIEEGGSQLTFLNRFDPA
jgi:hypothetical protein